MTTTDRQDLHAALLAKLTAEESPHRERLITLQIDHALTQPLSAWLDVDEVTSHLVGAMTKANVLRAFERHLHPSRHRIRARWANAGERPRDLLTEEGARRLEAMAKSERFPQGRWARGAVDPALIGKLLAPVLQEVLLGFVKKVVSTLPGIDATKEREESATSFASGLGLRSRFKATVGKRAEQIAGAGKSMLDGLGMDLEGRMKKVAREFSQTASETMRDAMKTRIKSEEGREILAEMRLQLLRRFLDTPLHEIGEDLEETDEATLREVVADSLEFNFHRAYFAEGVKEEVEAFLTLEGRRSLKELLEEAGTYEVVRGAMVERAKGVGKGFFESEGFASWLGELLEE